MQQAIKTWPRPIVNIVDTAGPKGVSDPEIKSQALWPRLEKQAREGIIVCTAIARFWG